MEVVIMIATTKKSASLPLCLCAAMKMELLLYMIYIADYQNNKNSSRANVAERQEIMPDLTMIVSNDELSLWIIKW